MKLDKASEARQLLKTTTQFVMGGVQLAASLWNQDVSGILLAIQGLHKTARDAKEHALEPW